MQTGTAIALGLAVAAAVAGGAYWYTHRKPKESTATITTPDGRQIVVTPSQISVDKQKYQDPSTGVWWPLPQGYAIDPTTGLPKLLGQMPTPAGIPYLPGLLAVPQK